MKSELNFLLRDIFLDPELPCSMREKVVARIVEIEENLAAQTVLPQLNHRVITNQPGDVQFYQPPHTPTPHMPVQAPSTLALMAKHGDIPTMPLPPQEAPPEPVAVIAQTQATAAAMQARSQSIADQVSGKIDKTTGRPRKW